MSIFSRIFDFVFAPAGTYDPASGLYNAANDHSYQTDSGLEFDCDIPAVNPATGLPMIDCGDGMGGIAGVDVGGSPWCQDIHQHDHYSVSNDSMFSHDCGTAVDHSSMFGCGSRFDTDISSPTFGCRFDDWP